MSNGFLILTACGWIIGLPLSASHLVVVLMDHATWTCPCYVPVAIVPLYTSARQADKHGIVPPLACDSAVIIAAGMMHRCGFAVADPSLKEDALHQKVVEALKVKRKHKHHSKKKKKALKTEDPAADLIERGKDALIKALSIFPEALQYTPEHWRSDSDVAIACLKQNGTCTVWTILWWVRVSVL